MRASRQHFSTSILSLYILDDFQPWLIGLEFLLLLHECLGLFIEQLMIRRKADKCLKWIKVCAAFAALYNVVVHVDDEVPILTLAIFLEVSFNPQDVELHKTLSIIHFVHSRKPGSTRLNSCWVANICLSAALNKRAQSAPGYLSAHPLRHSQALP